MVLSVAGIRLGTESPSCTGFMSPWLLTVMHVTGCLHFGSSSEPGWKWTRPWGLVGCVH